VYRRPDGEAVDPTLAEVAVRAPRATVCLTSALVHHDLTDAIPPMPDLALPRGQRFPVVGGPIAWHAFAITTFDLGRDDLDVGPGLQIGVYDAERTLVDTFRMRHRQGDDEAYEALRRWLRRRESQPSTLLTMAGHFPRSVAPIRQALTVLL
jgi:predicted transcriptional regulator of viral defense system